MSSKYSGRPGPPRDTPFGWVYTAVGQVLHPRPRGRPRSSRAGRGVTEHRAPRKRFSPACRAAPGARQVRAGPVPARAACRGSLCERSAGPEPGVFPQPRHFPSAHRALPARLQPLSPPDSPNGAGLGAEASPLKGT